MGLDGSVKPLDNDDLKLLKKILLENWNLLSEEIAYPFEYLKNFDD